MNILILTPTDPTSIVLCGQDLYNEYSEHNDLFSIQMMALLGETKPRDYVINNNWYAVEVRDNPRICIAKNTSYDNLIVFGNCDNKSIKFDHVITWDTIWKDFQDREDPYILKQEQDFEGPFRLMSIKPIRWYKRGDVEYSFPDWDHLRLFLKTLGVKANGVQ